MAGGILGDTKKQLGLGDETDEFDLDVMIQINAAFAVLTQLGIGPDGGFIVENADDQWDAFITDPSQLSMVKLYIYMKARLGFDPPLNAGFHISALERQIEQLEWRLNVKRENEEWTPPVPPTPVVDPEVILVPVDQAWVSE